VIELNWPELTGKSEKQPEIGLAGLQTILSIGCSGRGQRAAVGVRYA